MKNPEDYDVYKHALTIWDEMEDIEASKKDPRAVERAFFYWKGYLTATLGRDPTRSELSEKMEESWSSFQ